MEVVHLYMVHICGIFYFKERGVFMEIKYKADILSELKKRGYSTYRLRKEKILGEATIQKIRKGELVSWDNMATLCRLLGWQPGDLVEYVGDAPPQINDAT